MRVVTGRALMVAVDIRPGSPTLGRHVAVEGIGRGAAPVLGAGDVRPRLLRPERPRGDRVLLHGALRPRGRVRDPLGRPRHRHRVAGRRPAAVGRRTPPPGRSRTGWHGPKSAAFASPPRRLSSVRSGALAVLSIGAPGHPSAGSIGPCTTALVPVRRAVVRHLPRRPARLHALAFAGGVLILLLGITGWVVHGGPSTLEDVVVVLDLTIGGTLLVTRRARRPGPVPRRPAAAPSSGASSTPRAG